LDALETLADVLPLDEESQEQIVTSPNIGLAAKCPSSNLSRSVSLSITPTRQKNSSEDYEMEFSSGGISGLEHNETTSFSIPPEAINQRTDKKDCSDRKVTFIVHKTDKLFTTDEKIESEEKTTMSFVSQYQ